jgi:hypothetical protein
MMKRYSILNSGSTFFLGDFGQIPCGSESAGYRKVDFSLLRPNAIGSALEQFQQGCEAVWRPESR